MFYLKRIKALENKCELMETAIRGIVEILTTDRELRDIENEIAKTHVIDNEWDKVRMIMRISALENPAKKVKVKRG
jgi:hypothetical protein